MAIAIPHDRKVITVAYQPVGANRAFLKARSGDVLAQGPAGSGKTMAGMWKLHLAATKYPGARILLCRATMESLKTGALATYQKAVRPELDGVRPHGGNKFNPAEYRYPNGSVIVPGGLDKVEKFLSSEWDVIFVNEATEISEDTYEQLKTRLRNNVMPYQQILADCNPSYVRHWLNVRCNAGKTRRIVSTHRDNPAYWKNGAWTFLGREYLSRLETLSGVRRSRLLEGKWASAEGLVYPDFEPEASLQEIDTMWWRKVCGVDVGGINPTVVICASVSNDDRIHIDRVVYREKLMSAEAITKTVIDAVKGHKADTVFVDRSAVPTIGDLRNHGFYVETPDNTIAPGIQRVTSYIRRNALTLDPVNCVPLLDEFGEYAYPAKTQPGNENPVKDHDHAMDALRYMISGITANSGLLHAPDGDLADYLEQQWA